MKKKIVTITLALALLAGTTVVASANNSDAGITLDPNNEDPIIVEPKDPNDPNNPGDSRVPDSIEGLAAGLYFGKHDIEIGTKTYSSLPTAGDQPGNDTGSRERVGLSVESGVNFVVTVQLGEFFVGNDNAHQGAKLNLFTNGNKQDGSVELDGVWTQNGWQTSKHADIKIADNLNLTAGGASTTVVTATNVSGTAPTLWASNFAGELTILGGTARSGDAKADMTWLTVPSVLP
ncbi:MAG: WxL domain-containing protein [Oscillospiraceae bacterium]|nr:WxL domain-containing protein [Oscillospiraceae bacterium]